MTTKNPLWLADRPLVLASGSKTRRLMLEAADVPLEILRAPVDEAAIAKAAAKDGLGVRDIALELAAAKSAAAREKARGRLILTADQTLEHDGRLIMKSEDREEAKGQLRRLAGSTHHLHAAFVLSDGDRIIHSGVESAELTMRPVSAAFLHAYLDLMGERVLESVGGYQLEALGCHLFETIDGDHATILGLPLLAVLKVLRDHGFLLG